MCFIHVGLHYTTEHGGSVEKTNVMNKGKTCSFVFLERLHVCTCTFCLFEQNKILITDDVQIKTRFILSLLVVSSLYSYRCQCQVDDRPDLSLSVLVLVFFSNENTILLPSITTTTTTTTTTSHYTLYRNRRRPLLF